jgi:hypothetical protein
MAPARRTTNKATTRHFTLKGKRWIDPATARRMTGEKIVFGLMNDLNTLVIMTTAPAGKQQNYHPMPLFSREFSEIVGARCSGTT